MSKRRAMGLIVAIFLVWPAAVLAERPVALDVSVVHEAPVVSGAALWEESEARPQPAWVLDQAREGRLALADERSINRCRAGFRASVALFQPQAGDAAKFRDVCRHHGQVLGEGMGWCPVAGQRMTQGRVLRIFDVASPARCSTMGRMRLTSEPLHVIRQATAQLNPGRLA